MALGLTVDMYYVNHTYIYKLRSKNSEAYLFCNRTFDSNQGNSLFLDKRINVFY